MRSLDSSKHLWRVWAAIARTSVVREMEFRANFFAGLTRQILWLVAFLFFIDVVFQNTNQLAGWSQTEVVVVLALSRIIEGLIDSLFSRNIMMFPQAVQTGTFDFYLTKPIPAQFHTAFHNVSLDNIGNILIGVALLTYTFAVGITFSVTSAAIFILLAVCGVTIYYSLLILVASLAFILERLESLWSFSILFSEPLTVPFDVFPRVPRLALTYLVPLAFVVFVPAQAITGRLAWWQVPLGIGLAAFFLLLANLAWRAGLRRYSSASS